MKNKFLIVFLVFVIVLSFSSVLFVRAYTPLRVTMEFEAANGGDVQADLSNLVVQGIPLWLFSLVSPKLQGKYSQNTWSFPINISPDNYDFKMPADGKPVYFNFYLRSQYYADSSQPEAFSLVLNSADANLHILDEHFNVSTGLAYKEYNCLMRFDGVTSERVFWPMMFSIRCMTDNFAVSAGVDLFWIGCVMTDSKDDAEAQFNQLQDTLQSNHEAEMSQNSQFHQEDMSQAQEHFDAQMSQNQQFHQEDMTQAQQHFDAQMSQNQQFHDESMSQAQSQHDELMGEFDTDSSGLDSASGELDEQFERLPDTSDSYFDLNLDILDSIDVASLVNCWNTLISPIKNFNGTVSLPGLFTGSFQSFVSLVISLLVVIVSVRIAWNYFGRAG